LLVKFLFHPAEIHIQQSEDQQRGDTVSLSAMPYLCGCFSSSQNDEKQPPVRTQIPFNPQAGFRQNGNAPVPQDYFNGPSIDYDEGYSPVVPLPKYTPRPVSTEEKTLQYNSNNDRAGRNSWTNRNPDEKNRRDFNQDEEAGVEPGSPHPSALEEVTSDTSSAFSFPSTFDQTSTATRETPPPPYSSYAGSLRPSRSRASSMSHHTTVSRMTFGSSAPSTAPPLTPPPMAHIVGQRPLYRPSEFTHDHPWNQSHGGASDYQHNNPIPRGSWES